MTPLNPLRTIKTFCKEFLEVAPGRPGVAPGDPGFVRNVLGGGSRGPGGDLPPPQGGKSPTVTPQIIEKHAKKH